MWISKCSCEIAFCFITMWHRQHPTLRHTFTLMFNCCSDIWRVCRNSKMCGWGTQADGGMYRSLQKSPDVSWFPNASIILRLSKGRHIGAQRERREPSASRSFSSAPTWRPEVSDSEGRYQNQCWATHTKVWVSPKSVRQQVGVTHVSKGLLLPQFQNNTAAAAKCSTANISHTTSGLSHS